MKNENYEHVKSIAKDIERIANGELFKCPDCGAWIGEKDCEYNEMFDTAKCACGAEFSSDDLEPVTMFDYFENCLDVTYYSSGRGADDYQGVRVMVACGGPNIYIDTRRGCVELFWWNEYASADIWSDARDAIDEMFMELWSC